MSVDAPTATGRHIPTGSENPLPPTAISGTNRFEMRGILRVGKPVEIRAGEGTDAWSVSAYWAFSDVVAAMVGSRRRGPRQAQTVIGVPHDWQMNFPPPYTPVMEKVESLHDILLVIITLISRLRAGAAALRDVALPCLAQPDADDHDPQHGARDRLDDHPDPDPGGDRDPVLPAALLRRQGGRRGDDHQGDRPPVVLVLRTIPTRAISRSRAAS